MDKLDKWVSDRLADVAQRLPASIHSDPASFACGFNTGYKQALLDLMRHLKQESTAQDI